MPQDSILNITLPNSTKETPKTKSWYIKTTIISILLFIETLALGNFFEQFVYKADYFSLTSNNALFLNIGITMFLILLTFSLSLGGWLNYEEYFYLSISIGTAIAFILINHDMYNGISVSLILGLFIAYYVYSAKSYKKLLIKFQPQFILYTSLKGLVFVLSVFGVAVLMIGKSSTDINSINVGEKIVTAAKEPLKNTLYFSGLNIGVENLVQDKINSSVAPYRNLFKPIMGLFVYFIFVFIGNIAYYICYYLLPYIFTLAKILKLIKVDIILVEQEVPRF